MAPIDVPPSPDPIVTELNNLSHEVNALRTALRTSRRTTRLIGLLAVATLALGGIWFLDDRSDDQRTARVAEHHLQNGCENAAAADRRAALRSKAFAERLGQAMEVDPVTVQEFIADVEHAVDVESPPRDCEAEAEHRQTAQEAAP